MEIVRVDSAMQITDTGRSSKGNQANRNFTIKKFS